MSDTTPQFAMVDTNRGVWQRWSPGLQTRSTCLQTHTTRVKACSIDTPCKDQNTCENMLPTLNKRIAGFLYSLDLSLVQSFAG